MQLNIVFTILGLCAASQSSAPTLDATGSESAPSSASGPSELAEIDKIARFRQVVHCICIFVSLIVMIQIGKVVFAKKDDDSHTLKWWRGDKDHQSRNGGSLGFKKYLGVSFFAHACGIIHHGIVMIAFIATHQEVNADFVVGYCGSMLLYIVLAVYQTISLSKKSLERIAKDENDSYREGHVSVQSMGFQLCVIFHVFWLLFWLLGSVAWLYST